MCYKRGYRKCRMHGQAKVGNFEMLTDTFILQSLCLTFGLILPNLYYILLCLFWFTIASFALFSDWNSVAL